MAPHLSAISQSNAALVGGLKGAPVAVFLGGTSGIGQGLADTFAQWRNGNAHIIILGRNEAAARDIIAHFPKPTASGASWSHEFIQCDATLMKNVRAAAEQILAKHPKVNYLVMSPGYFSTSGRDETPEGIDKKLAVHYYSRWRLTYDLLPALNKAKEEGEDVRVLSVFSTGYGRKIDGNDLGLKKTFSVKNAAESAATYNDLMIEAFHERNPGIVFSHVFPGGVSTNLMNSARTPWMRAVAPVANALAKPFLVTQDQCAEYLWSGLLNTTIGAYRMGRKGEDLGKKGYYGNKELTQKLWEHSKDATDV
ncbi:Oxidoreductase [Psilocybe cubensis]|uniref:NAD(P)-binding protein n=2 Tax=Psilocybe cubensis TaxID=181762 RepID=A0A8H7Y5Q4_PSICU|nr:Oxidoreductase [Psilocybe cubensis]KAH9485721.1 Oxidoreductase [Psilocybe cubensis]